MRIPDLGEDLPSSDHRPWIESEKSEQIEFLRSKWQFFPGQQHTV